MVAVDHQHPLPHIRQGGGKIQCDGGFPNTSLEVQDRDDRTLAILTQGDEWSCILRERALPDPPSLGCHTLKVLFQLLDGLALAVVESLDVAHLRLAGV